MRKKYVAYCKKCTIEVTGEKDFMYSREVQKVNGWFSL